MQNTTQEFKVGDKVKYKEIGFAENNNHIRDKIYTVSDVEPTQGWLTFEEGGWPVLPMWIEHYTPEPKKHIHHDLIIAWAKDPKDCIIQVKDSFNKWNDTLENNPAWSDEQNYRIKPKTKEVTRWKWVVKTIVGTTYFVTDAKYTEEEAKGTFKHFTGIKIPDTAVTTIEEA